MISIFKERLSAKVLWPFYILGFILFIAQCFVTLYPGDDLYFVQAMSEHNNDLIQFVSMRYMTWSGRITSEFLVGLFTLFPLWIWRILNTFIAVLFVGLLAYIIKLPLGKPLNNSFNLIINSFVCIFFFIIPISVTTRACSWFTGSFYYLWPTLALFIALLPFLKALYQLPITKNNYILSFIASCYAAYMEQTAAILLCFGFITIVYLYIREHKVRKWLVLQSGFTLLHVLVYQLSPGNTLRFKAEVQNWYPEFESLSLLQKLTDGINWTHTHLIKDATWLMLSLSLLAFILILPKLKRTPVKVLSFLPSLYFIGAMIPFNTLTARTTSYEYNFDVQHMVDTIFFKASEGIIPALISLVILIVLGVLFTLALDFSIDSFIVTILYLAALAAGYILGFSPTLYASGPRVFFVSNILLLLIGGILLRTVWGKIKINKLIWQIVSIFYISLATIFAGIYIGGLAIKTLFKID